MRKSILLIFAARDSAIHLRAAMLTRAAAYARDHTRAADACAMLTARSVKDRCRFSLRLRIFAVCYAVPAVATMAKKIRSMIRHMRADEGAAKMRVARVTPRCASFQHATLLTCAILRLLAFHDIHDDKDMPT